MDPVDQPDPFGDQLTAVIAKDPQLFGGVVRAPGRDQVLLAGGDPGDRQGVDRVGLAAAGAAAAFPHGEPARHLTDVEPDVDQPRRGGPAQVPGSFDADPGHAGVGQPLAQPQVTFRVVGERVAHLAAGVVDDRDGESPFV